MSVRVALLLLLIFALASACETRLPTAGSACATIADCAAAAEPLACADNICQRLSCVALSDCPIGAACVAGVCRAPECAQDTDCDDPQAQCFLGECRLDLCRSRVDCPAGLICAGTPPQCAPPPMSCVGDAECPVGQSCNPDRRRCDRSCRLDAECAPVGACRQGFCRSRCTDDEGCDSGEVCAAGLCQLPSDCSDAEPCGGVLPLRDPISCACQQCLSDEDCGRQQRCDAGVCRGCLQTAGDQALCTAQGLLFEDGCCIECLSDADCDAGRGERCERNACIDAVEGRCVEDADCPVNTICDGLRCAPSATLAPCVFQTDCPAGEACYPDARCRREAAVCDQGRGCPDGTRCVAEPGDTLGACVGCTALCAPAGCPAGQACALPSGAAEGACIDAAICR
jgi:hypothetical protein